MTLAADGKPIRPIFTFDGHAEAESKEEETRIDVAQEEESRIVADEDIVETRPARVAKQPNAPTKAEIESHLPLHAEYRDWCPSCVYGKGISHSQ